METSERIKIELKMIKMIDTVKDVLEMKVTELLAIKRRGKR